MARTKASVGAKVSSGKSSKARCCAAPAPSSSSSTGGGGERSARGGSSGGNPVCPRETPKWQRPITNFFIGKEPQNDEAAGSSKSKKRNVIESDDEEEETKTESEKAESSNTKEKPKNQTLDETIELEPLSGEDSHKIEEYYPKNGVKGKGVGKKTNKENIDANIERRKSVKRDLEDVTFSEEIAHPSKKVKVN